MNRRELEQRAKTVVVDRLLEVSDNQAMAELWYDVVGSPAKALEGGVLIKNHESLHWVFQHAVDRIIKDLTDSYLVGFLREHEMPTEGLEECLDDCE